MKTIANYKTQNEGYGFHGTIAESAFVRALIDQAYNAAAHVIKAKRLLQTDEEIVEFLDSRAARHLADQLVGAESVDEMAIRMEDLDIANYITWSRCQK